MGKVYNAAFLYLPLLAALGHFGRVEADGQIVDIFAAAAHGMVESASGVFGSMENASSNIKNTATSKVEKLSDPISGYFESMTNDTEWTKPEVKNFEDFIKVWKSPGAVSTTEKPTSRTYNLTESVVYNVESDSEVVQVQG